MPATMTLIGSVARLGSGASIEAMIDVVATITVLLPPASACATASTTALRAASRSSVRSNAGSATVGSAITAMDDSQNLSVLAAEGQQDYLGQGRSEVQGAVVADHDR